MAATPLNSHLHIPLPIPPLDRPVDEKQQKDKHGSTGLVAAGVTDEASALLFIAHGNHM